jgi:hypothetical protein
VLPVEDPQNPGAAVPNAHREKAVYARPVLVVFGSVAKLTQNGDGSGTDGGPATMMCL